MRLPWLSLSVLALGACGDSAGGTTHTSPPLAPLDGVDGSTSGPGAGDDAGGSTGVDSGWPDAAPTPPVSCTGKTGGKGDLTLSLTSGGLARTSLLHVPPSYDPTQGTMVVVDYHGFSSDAAQEVLLTNMNPVADAKGFVVVTPYGLGQGWNAGDCCTELQPPSVDDVQFTKDLLALVSSQYCVDPRRVYATGMSNGGFLSHRLACAMADTFAAVAPVAGVLGIPPEQCTPSRPVPVLDFHGTGDPVVPYDGGPAAKLLPPITFRSVPDTMAFWRTADACLGAPVVTYQQGVVTCTRWSDCSGGVDVELCTVDGGGHQWPGSSIVVPGLGNGTTDVDATARIVDFFLAHPM
ncbi:MAG TPA: PHB depolymerase family esterase [Polyangiaceae bacterium]|jgi:polyhydroxybutyrate depolymerase